MLDVHGSVLMEKPARGPGKRGWAVGWRELISVMASRRIIAASNELADFLVNHYGIPRSRCWTVPNGVPLSLLGAVDRTKLWRTNLRLAAGELMAIHVAPGQSFANEASVTFLSRVAQLLRRSPLKLRFVLTGRMSAPEGLTPVGMVQDYLGLLDAADLTLLPYPVEAVCGGARNKALEFLARGKAIVSTREGMRGVERAQAGRDFIEAESPEQFAEAIATLAGDEYLRNRLGTAARLLAQSYTWTQSATILSRTFEGMLSN